MPSYNKPKIEENWKPEGIYPFRQKDDQPVWIFQTEKRKLFECNLVNITEALSLPTELQYFQVYSFSFSQEETHLKQNLFDLRISQTICKIIAEHGLTTTHTVVAFICDHSDGILKTQARLRLFANWFRRSNQSLLAFIPLKTKINADYAPDFVIGGIIVNKSYCDNLAISKLINVMANKVLGEKFESETQ